MAVREPSRITSERGTVVLWAVGLAFAHIRWRIHASAAARPKGLKTVQRALVLLILFKRTCFIWDPPLVAPRQRHSTGAATRQGSLIPFTLASRSEKVRPLEDEFRSSCYENRPEAPARGSNCTAEHQEAPAATRTVESPPRCRRRRPQLGATNPSGSGGAAGRTRRGPCTCCATTRSGTFAGS